MGTSISRLILSKSYIHTASRIQICALCAEFESVSEFLIQKIQKPTEPVLASDREEPRDAADHHRDLVNRGQHRPRLLRRLRDHPGRRGSAEPVVGRHRRIDSSEIAIKPALSRLKGRVEPAQASLFTPACPVPGCMMPLMRGRAYYGFPECTLFTSTWRSLYTTTAPLSSAALGDFEGDGHTDAFRRRYAVVDRAEFLAARHSPLYAEGIIQFDRPAMRQLRR
jgi:hypothetical protein